MIIPFFSLLLGGIPKLFSLKISCPQVRPQGPMLAHRTSVHFQVRLSVNKCRLFAAGFSQNLFGEWQ
jgi:hypothetical protein